MKAIYTLLILLIPFVGNGQCFYCEDFESVTAPNLPDSLTTTSLEANYFTISDGSLVELSPGGFYTGNAADANAGGYWPVGEHGQFAMTSDDACRPGGVVPNNNNNCDLAFETLTLPVLDFTGQFDLYLKFEYYHDQNYGGGDANVEVSIDGGITFTDISGPLPNLEAWQQGIFSLSDYNDQNSIVIRFVWSDAGSWTTGFAVDDIEIKELPENSLSMPLFNQWLVGYDGFASSYSQIPLNMILNSSGIIFQSHAKNTGMLTQDSVRLHASATGFTSQSYAINLESQEQGTLQCNEGFIPTATGTYQLDYYLQSDNVTTATNSKSIDITDYIYARDDNEMDGANSLLHSGDGISTWERGTIYDIYESNTLYAIDVYIHNSTTENAKIQGKIYLFQDGQTFFLSETNLSSVTTSDGWQSIIFANPVSLDAESQYLITVGGDGSAFNDTVRIGSSGNVQSSYGYIFYNGWVDSNGNTATDGTTASTPMVRMNMNPNLLIYGCLDENACNYDENANADDGNCLYPVSYEQSYSTCNNFEWNGEVYSQSGEYSYVTSGSNGCDSTTILYLTIINSINVNIDITSCDEYLWQGEIYAESGTYTYETVNVNGCDSIINLNLSIVEGLESQTIIGQDEVEAFSSHIYALTLNENSYSWSVTNGSILSNNGNNIEVFWGEFGIGLIEVIETDENGCTITHSLQVNLGNNVENSWNCINNACVDPLDGTGFYDDLNECEQACQNISSLNEISFDIRIYPNPSSDIFNIELNSDSETEILVTNILGEKVYNESIKSIGEYNTQIDISDYSKGIYNLTIKTSDGISNYKLILQ